MELMQAIEHRRSIRSFTGDPVSREQIQQILRAGILAPSAKNGQPWRFVVVTHGEREAMIAAMDRGLAQGEERFRDDPQRLQHIANARHTRDIMAAAPVTVLMFNPYGASPLSALAGGDLFSEMANIQSVGAAIENMCLAATDMGLGSLWICDVFSAYCELLEWAGTTSQLLAAVSFGHPAQAPAARPRMGLEEVVTWR